MEYIYSALLLHKAGKKVDEASVTKILEAAGLKPEHARVKALVSALEGVDIEKAIEKAAMPVQAHTESVPVKKEEKKKEEPKEDESKAAAGLGALFG